MNQLLMPDFAGQTANFQQNTLAAKQMGIDNTKQANFQNALAQGFEGQRSQNMGQFAPEQQAQIQQAIQSASAEERAQMAQRYNIVASALRDATPENFGAISAAVRQRLPDTQIPQTWQEYEAVKPQIEANMSVLGGALGIGQGEGFTLSEGAVRFDANGNPIAGNIAPEDGRTNDIKTIQQAAQMLGLQAGTPEYTQFVQEQMRGTPLVENNLGDTLTPFQRSVDNAFASDYLEWTQNGSSDAVKQIEQLSEALVSLESGTPLTGTARNLLSPTVQAFFNTEGVIAKEAVEEVVQRNLRLILGAQFTEKEGERLIARAYNERLPEEENAKRVRRLLNQMVAAAEQKENMAQFVEQNGTLHGYTGDRPSVGDFYEAIDAEPRGGNNVMSEADAILGLD